MNRISDTGHPWQSPTCTGNMSNCWEYWSTSRCGWTGNPIVEDGNHNPRLPIQKHSPVPDIHAVLVGQPRQPHNIKSLKELRMNLSHSRGLATYLSDFAVSYLPQWTILQHFSPSDWRVVYLICLWHVDMAVELRRSSVTWTHHHPWSISSLKSASLYNLWVEHCFPLLSHLCQSRFVADQTSCFVNGFTKLPQSQHFASATVRATFQLATWYSWAASLIGYQVRGTPAWWSPSPQVSTIWFGDYYNDTYQPPCNQSSGQLYND